MSFWECVKYLAFISAFGFVAGRLLPKSLIQWDKFPFKPWDFEDNGNLYRSLKIRTWQDKLPDMSRIFKRIMPEKKMPKHLSEEAITVMLRETCVAEMIHILLGISGLYCCVIWRGLGGRLVAAAYLIGNLPFVMIQRFNRPKLKKILLRIQKISLKSVCQNKEGKLCEF